MLGLLDHSQLGLFEYLHEVGTGASDFDYFRRLLPRLWLKVILESLEFFF